MTFSNLPNLQSFETGNNSFIETTSLSLSSMIIILDYLTFSNLPNLQSFITGDWSFEETTSLSLSSMIIKFDYFLFSNLPNLQSFITGNQSFEETTSLSLSSMIIKFSINSLDVPFTNGEFNSMLFRDKNVDDIECDESIVVNE